jgi:hypothetical protein
MLVNNAHRLTNRSVDYSRSKVNMRQLKGLAFSFVLALSAPSYAFAQCCYLDTDSVTSNPKASHIGKPSLQSEISINTTAGPFEYHPIIDTAALSAAANSKLSAPAKKPLKGEVAKASHHKKTREPLALKIKEDEFSSDLLAGSTFPIELEGTLSSKESVAGDKVVAHLTQDLKIGSLLLAEKGTIVEGTVSKVVPACSGLKSNKLNKRFRNANGGIQIEFSRMLGSSTNYEISAVPAKGSDVKKLSATEQQLIVNSLGELSVPYHAGRYTMLAIAISGGSMAAGPFGMAGAPAISAFCGALMPAYGLGRPAHPGEKYVRVKGAVMGALRGAPGGFLASGLFVRGLEATLASGDQITLRLNKNLSVPTHQKLSILPSQ